LEDEFNEKAAIPASADAYMRAVFESEDGISHIARRDWEERQLGGPEEWIASTSFSVITSSMSGDIASGTKDSNGPAHSHSQVDVDLRDLVEITEAPPICDTCVSTCTTDAAITSEGRSQSVLDFGLLGLDLGSAFQNDTGHLRHPVKRQHYSEDEEADELSAELKDHSVSLD
jgi:hypothetical protein